MATLVESPLIGKKILYIKGAPELVLGKCKEVVLDGRRVDAVEYRSTVDVYKRQSRYNVDGRD